ncbi:hypothetical protein [Vibrio sp. 2096]|nr:hypothetical protein [Vibrio sp. 2096]
MSIAINYTIEFMPDLELANMSYTFCPSRSSYSLEAHYINGWMLQ